MSVQSIHHPWLCAVHRRPHPVVPLGSRRRAVSHVHEHALIRHLRAPTGVVGGEGEVELQAAAACSPGRPVAVARVRHGEGDARWAQQHEEGSDDGRHCERREESRQGVVLGVHGHQAHRRWWWRDVPTFSST